MSGMSKRVAFLDLGAEFRGLEAQWIEAIRASGQTGSFILGPEVSAFEREIADYVGVGHAIAVANGTDSLVLSLRALDIGAGDEVITTPFTFFATAEAITIVGAKPVFADILPDCYTIDPASVRACITERTRAILPVHLFGHPARMDEIRQIARQYRLAVIEDCAQAFGATVGGKRVGSMGDAGSFSFYPTKVLGCYGDGGMITTDSLQLADRLRRLRNHGAVRPFIHTEIGYNSRLDEIQAALLRVKLRNIDRAIAGRRAVAEQYRRGLANLPLTLPSEPKEQGHVFNLYTARSAKRDALRAALTAQEVASSVCYPVPLHLQDVYQGLGYRPGSLPVAEKAAGEVLSLPIYPGMPAGDIARVCDVTRAAL